MRPTLNILYNFHWIVPGEAARSAQAYAGLLGPFLDSNRLKGLINLRGHNPSQGWWRYETVTCERHGVTHFDAMLNSRRLPRREMLLALFDAFDAAPKPFLIKCSGGQDRTSFAAALYLIHRQGWNAMAQARAQFARFPYLHLPKKQQRWLQHFLDFANSGANGAPIREWIERAYDPGALAAWLEANGKADSFHSIFEMWQPTWWQRRQ
jgi:protein tyrosine/serine phosphatase